MSKAGQAHALPGTSDRPAVSLVSPAPGATFYPHRVAHQPFPWAVPELSHPPPSLERGICLAGPSFRHSSLKWTEGKEQRDAFQKVQLDYFGEVAEASWKPDHQSKLAGLCQGNAVMLTICSSHLARKKAWQLWRHWHWSVVECSLRHFRGVISSGRD